MDCGIVQPSDGKFGQASLTDRLSNGCRREPDHGLEPPGLHPETGLMDRSASTPGSSGNYVGTWEAFDVNLLKMRGDEGR